MPGISRSSAASSVASRCGWLAAISAPERYARILNGLSFLISSRSAISPRMRAMARLSKPQAFRFDVILEQARTSRSQRRSDGVARRWRAVAEEAAAAARSAHFGGGRAGGRRARDEIVDRGRGHAGREALAGVPLGRDLPADLVPVAALKRRTHCRRRIANPLETVEDVPIAVDMALGDLPVVRARIAGLTRIGEHHAALELGRIDVESDAVDAVGPELDGGDP